jgi:hypothetical protein
MTLHRLKMLFKMQLTGKEILSCIIRWIFFFTLLIIHHTSNFCLSLWVTGLNVLIHIYLLLQWAAFEKRNEVWFHISVRYRL